MTIPTLQPQPIMSGHTLPLSLLKNVHVFKYFYEV